MADTDYQSTTQCLLAPPPTGILNTKLNLRSHFCFYPALQHLDFGVKAATSGGTVQEGTCRGSRP